MITVKLEMIVYYGDSEDILAIEPITIDVINDDYKPPTVE